MESIFSGAQMSFEDIVLSRRYRGLDHKADRDCLCSTFKFSLKSVESLGLQPHQLD